jgi:diguanylate cyclase (GGDEF)-like protein/PAS domain S-box-containing protein
LAQAYEAHLSGVEVATNSRLLFTGLPHDAVVAKVLSGDADVGFVRAGVLEDLAKRGTLDLGQIRVINPQTLAGYPFMVSTRLYPECILAALPHTEKDLQRAVTVFLLSIEDSHPDLVRRLGIHGFELPANLSGIESLLTELRVPPFDLAPTITLRDVWVRFRLQVMVALGSLALLALLGLRLIATNRRLREERAKTLQQTDLLRETNRLLDGIIQHAPTMIFVKRAADLSFVMMNRAGEALLGVKSADLVGHGDHEFFPKEQADQFAETDKGVLASREAVDISECEMSTPMGLRILHTRKVAICDESGRATHLLGISEDITERRKSEKEIEALAFYDPLTQLPNRRLMIDRLRQAMSDSARSGRQGAILMIDLDNFKTLNDTMGHEMGDQLLIEVAARLKASVREGDTVARMGGDEFILILRGLSPSDEAVIDAEAIAKKVLTQLAHPFVLNYTGPDGTPATHRHHSSGSIGITLYQGNGISVEELFKRADTAMYQAKQAGRNALRFFDVKMHASVVARASLEDDLRTAIVNEEFFLYFQPQVDFSGTCTGAEILIRWRSPKRGMVSPAEFIPVAEQSGLILPMGHFVMRSARAKLAHWARRPETARLSLAINVSALQFNLPTFVEELDALLLDSGANPERLKLELTESLMFEHTEEIICKMQALRKRGIAFALDDFGTGYSSLSYLKRLPFSQLKIDQSFVRDLLIDSNDEAIARTIVALGKTLGMSVIAEGVETVAQRDLLAMLECYAYQGYLYGRPMPVEEFEALVAENWASTVSL